MCPSKGQLKGMIKIRRKLKPKYIILSIFSGFAVCLILIIINLALNSPSSGESYITEPVVSSTESTTELTTEDYETSTAENTTKPTEKATQKATKKANDKKSESKNDSDSSNHEQSEGDYNHYYNYSDSISSNSNFSENSNNSESSSKTTKPTTKSSQVQVQDNIYLSYSTVFTGQGDVVFLSLINAENGISWSVSDSSVLQNYGGSSNQCSFRALKRGSATVTATYNGKNYYCTVTVN